MAPGITRSFDCSCSIFGSWICINKPHIEPGKLYLHFQELEVYGSKYISAQYKKFDLFHPFIE